MRVLEQFMIGLGLQVDKKSFDQGSAAFDGISKSALQLGATLAAKLGIEKVVTDFKNAGSELENFNRLNGTAAENVQKLGYALQRQGGQAADAFGMLKNIQNLMASPITGNTGWMGEVARFGVDPRTVTGAKSTTDAILDLSDAFSQMNKVQQVQAGRALGLDDAQIRLLSSGRTAIEGQFKAASQYNLLTKEQTEDAQELNRALMDSEEVFKSMGRIIGGELTPAITEMVKNFNEFYVANKDLIDSGLKEFFGGVAENIELVTAALLLMGGSGALKGLAALRALVGGGAAAGAAGSAAATGGASLLGVAAGGLGALLYSSSLNSGEDEIVRKRIEAEGGRDMTELAIQHFQKKGWTRNQAAGIVANLDAESRLDPTAVGDSGKAYGAAQWHPDRQADFKAWSGKDIRGSSLEEQLNFVDYEMTKGKEQGAGNRLRRASTAVEAGAVVSRYYERPRDTEGEAELRGGRAENLAARGDDNRQYNFYGADEAMVKKVIREEVGEMASQTMNDMKSSEK